MKTGIGRSSHLWFPSSLSHTPPSFLLSTCQLPPSLPPTPTIYDRMPAKRKADDGRSDPHPGLTNPSLPFTKTFSVCLASIPSLAVSLLGRLTVTGSPQRTTVRLTAVEMALLQQHQHLGARPVFTTVVESHHLQSSRERLPGKQSQRGRRGGAGFAETAV